MLNPAPIAVAATAVALASGVCKGSGYNAGAKTIYTGGSGVTAVNGIPIAAGAYFSFELKGGDTLYAICNGADTSTVNITTTEAW